MRYEFLSDNTAGMCPEAIAALLEHNAGFVPGYGADVITQQAGDAVRALLDADVEVRFVPSGTAANALACAALCRPFEAIVAHEHAHIRTHEAGAPSFFGQGLKLRGLAGKNGKIEKSALLEALATPDAAHWQGAAALSVTNATEYGTLYTNDEFRDLCDLARSRGVRIHVDGARLANAVAAGFDLRTLVDCGVDVLVIGGAKAGAPLSEALVLLDKRLSRRFDARLKQSGQLCSKSRFLAAPWIGLLAADTSGAFPWVSHARHANAMARKLAQSMPFEAVHPVEANSVFVELDEARLVRLGELGWRVGRFPSGAVRFTCSWAVTDEVVGQLVAALTQIA